MLGVVLGSVPAGAVGRLLESVVLRVVAFGVALAPVVAVAGVAGRRVGSRIAALALLAVATLAVAGVVVRGLTGPLPVAAVVVATYAATGVALYAGADRVAVAGWLLVAPVHAAACGPLVAAGAADPF